MPHVTIIAEAGVNHGGDLERALQLVDAAADAGADIVKFQTFKASALVTANAPKADYQQRNTPNAPQRSQLEMLRSLELTDEHHRAIISHCRQRGIRFLSTPFDSPSADYLASLGMTTWKVPSGEITDLPLLRHIGQLASAPGSDVILSTGMSTLDEVEAAIRVIEAAGTPRTRITLLHCTTQYPTPFEDVNLMAMDSLRSLGCRAVGYSDHTLGIAVPIAAAARGAAVVEKHFTLDRNLPGPDHKASLEPAELASMVNAIRTVEAALGSPEKRITPSERANIAVARRSIVAARPIAQGELFTEDNLTTKRPGTGLSPMLWDTLIGTPAPQPYLPNDPINTV